MHWKCRFFRHYPVDHRVPLSLEGVWEDLGRGSSRVFALAVAFLWMLLLLASAAPSNAY